MNKNFDTALTNAFKKEFSWLDYFENPYENYKFSSQFESNMKNIISKSKSTYISVGKKRIRKTLLAALVALLAIIITGCALTIYYFVDWHEEQNDKKGTLDIGFEIDNGQTLDSALPAIPNGYTIVSEISDDSSHVIRYSNGDGLQIGFTRYSDIENRNISIDNEDAAFSETTINGYKGYIYAKDGLNALYWADTTYFYILQGTCDVDVLLTMANSTIN